MFSLHVHLIHNHKANMVKYIYQILLLNLFFFLIAKEILDTCTVIFIFQNSGISKSIQFCFSTSLNNGIHWTSSTLKYEKISAQQIMLKLFLFMSLMDKIKRETLPLFLLCRRWGRTKCALCGVGSVSCHQLLYLSTGLHLCNL